VNRRRLPLTPARLGILFLGLMVSLLVGGSLVVATLAPAEAAKLPTKKHWVKDTRKAMNGSRAWIDTRTASPKPTDKQLAVNLDIDNTSLATKYAPGKAVAVTLRFVKYADAHHVAILFNTGRLATQLSGITQQLRSAGYPIDAICGRHAGEGLVHSKERCRAAYVAQGYTIIANVGNSKTDFTGGDYERAFRLPNYHGRLG
jgi:predicted secreted acid phosphatase